MGALVLLTQLVGCQRVQSGRAGVCSTADSALDIGARLSRLPGVTADEQPSPTAGYRRFVLHFTQPVDHGASGGQTFQQEVSLLHRDTTSPLVIESSGYGDGNEGYPDEITSLIAGNQISIEHRYFAPSRPDPPDWTKLTIEQMAADEHAIVSALSTIYCGKYVSTGVSKGGMTATYFRRFYPDDVDATVAYSSPLSLAAPDTRYSAFVDTIGTPSCRQALRDLAVEALSHRRDAMVQLTQADADMNDHQYNLIKIGPAVESAFIDLEWAFWQYYGVSYCGLIPAVTASDMDIWQFVQEISVFSDSDDSVVTSFAPYIYQAYTQLGFPDNPPYLTSYLQYSDADYANLLPTQTVPPFDPKAMQDIDSWVQDDGSRLLFVYGEWDPYAGGKYVLGHARDSALYVASQGTHGTSLMDLSPSDQTAAYAKLREWTGVTPKPATMSSLVRRSRLPSAVVRARRAPSTDEGL